MSLIRPAVNYIPDLNFGRPLSDAQVYLLTSTAIVPQNAADINPADLLTVTYLNDADNTVEAPQPLRTTKGGCLFTGCKQVIKQFSVNALVYIYAVYDKNGNLEYQGKTTGSDFVDANDLAATDSTVLVGGVEAGKIGDLKRAFRTPQDYGAKADGITDDSVAIANAIAYCKINGYNLISSPNDKFFLGTFPDDDYASKCVIDFDNFTWVTNNCTFLANASVAAFHDGRLSQVLFDVINASNTNIGDFKFFASTIARDGSDRQGVHAVVLRNVAKSTSNLTLGTINGSKLESVLTVVSSAPALYRHTGINFKELINANGYYGLNCANNGDKVTGTIRCTDCIRSYFVYGVDGQNVETTHKDHLKFTDVVIARTTRDTKNINVTVNTNSFSSSGVCSFEFLTDDVNGVIDNVKMNIAVSVSNAGNPTLKFNDLDGSGVARASTTNRFSNIRIEGTSNSTTPTQLNVQSTGETNCAVDIAKNLLNNLTDSKRFNLISSNRRLALGNAANNMQLKFYVGDLKFVPNWGRLRIWAADNPTASSAEYIAADYWVLFSVGSNGVVAILRSEIIGTAFTAGSLTTSILFPAQAAGSFNLVVSATGYTNAGRLVKGELTVFSGTNQW